MSSASPGHASVGLSRNKETPNNSQILMSWKPLSPLVADAKRRKWAQKGASFVPISCSAPDAFDTVATLKAPLTPTAVSKCDLSLLLLQGPLLS